MNKLKSLLLQLPLVVLCASLVRAETLYLSAASSLTEVVKEVVDHYMGSHPGTTVLANFGGSGGLAKQIRHGAPADIFLSANPVWTDYLIQGRYLEPDTVRTLARNQLVFIATPQVTVDSLAGIVILERIGIGSVRTVPAGQYAAQALKAAGIYRTLYGKGKLVMAKNVRQALLYVDRGEVDGAFVYGTDAVLARRAKVLFVVDERLHDPILYRYGLTPGGKEKRAARELHRYLAGNEVATILTRYGFADSGKGNR